MDDAELPTGGEDALVVTRSAAREWRIPWRSWESEEHRQDLPLISFAPPENCASWVRCVKCHRF